MICVPNTHGWRALIYLEIPRYQTCRSYKRLGALSHWTKHADVWLKPGQGCIMISEPNKWGSMRTRVSACVPEQGIITVVPAIQSQKRHLEMLGHIDLIGGSGKTQHLLRLLCALGRGVTFSEEVIHHSRKGNES